MNDSARMALMLAVTAISVITVDQRAVAQQRVFDIPSESASQAIPDFSKQAGYRVVASADQLAGITTNAVKGQQDANSALKQLIGGTGLVIASNEGSLVTLERPVDSPSSTANLHKIVLAQNSTGQAVQSGPPPAAELADAPLLEIVVTGTYIRGIAPIGSEVIHFDQQDIQQIGAANLTDTLRTLPQALNTGVTSSYSNTAASSTTTNNTRANTINLRGLGSDATLLLIDGNRVAGGSSTGIVLDPSTIPQIAVSSLSVLADGNSAIYGSDAVAGVVNVRLRPDFQGAETVVRDGGPIGAHEWLVDQIVGQKWDTGGMMVAYERDHQNPLQASSRSQYYNSNLSDYGIAPQAASYFGSPGNIQVTSGTVNYAGGPQNCSKALPCYVGIPPGAGTTYAGLQTAPGVFRNPNVYNQWLYNTVTPKNDRDSLVFNGHQDITDGIEITNEAFWTDREFETAGSPLEGTVSIPATNPYSPCATVVPRPATGLCSGAATTVKYAYTEEAPLNSSSGHSRNLTDTLALNAKLVAGWNGVFSATYSRNNDSQNAPDFQLKIGQTGTPAYTAGFNPFGSVYNANNVALDGALYALGNIEKYVLKNYAARFDGPLFPLPAGTVKAAAGVEYRSDFTNISQYSQGAIGVDADLSRNVKSVYAEVAIPFVDENMGIPLVRKLDIDAAARYQRYSDFGSTTNPKVGLNWVVAPGLLVRASYGTSFRAPELTEMLTLSGPATVLATVPLAGGGTGNALYVGGGNPSLQPETAKTFSFGPEWRPGFIPNLTLSANYYNIDFKNQIQQTGSVTNPNVLSNPAYSPFIIAQGAAVTQVVLDKWLNYINSNGLVLRSMVCPTNPPPLSCVDAIIDGRNVNAGRILTSGLDLVGNYDLDTRYGKFDFGLNGNYVFDFKTAVSPTASLIENVGNNNGAYPVSFRARALVGWQKDAFRVTSFLNFTSAYDNNTIVTGAAQRVPAWTTMDLTANYDLGHLPTPLNGFNLSLIIVNVFDKAPPFVLFEGATYTTFDPQNANALGRAISLQLTKKW